MHHEATSRLYAVECIMAQRPPENPGRGIALPAGPHCPVQTALGLEGQALGETPGRGGRRQLPVPP